MDFSDVIDAIGVDLKIAIDDLIHQVKQLREDLEDLKRQKDLSE